VNRWKSALIFRNCKFACKEYRSQLETSDERNSISSSSSFSAFVFISLPFSLQEYWIEDPLKRSKPLNSEATLSVVKSPNDLPSNSSLHF
jgi:hypothetical protein